MRNDDLHYAATVQSPGWLIAEPLDPAIGQQIAEFNLRGLRQQQAASTTDAAGSVPAFASQWQALDPQALQRLASMPFLLFELGLDTSPLFARAGAGVTAPGPDAASLEFAGQLLNYAWHLARANPLGAALRLGMPSGSVAELRELSFSELHALTAPAARCLRLRWGEPPTVWKQLLAAAKSHDPEALEREQLAGLRRLAGELMVPAGAGGAGRVAEPLW